MRNGKRLLFGLLLTALLSAGNYFHLTQFPEYLTARLIFPFMPTSEGPDDLYLQINPPPDNRGNRGVDSSYLVGLVPLLAEFDAKRLIVTQPVVSFPAPAATAALRGEIRTLLLLEQAQRNRDLPAADAALLTDALELANSSLRGWDGALTYALEWFPHVASIPPLNTKGKDLLPRGEFSGGSASWAGSRWRQTDNPQLYLIPPVPAGETMKLPDSRLRELLAAETRLVAWTAEFQNRRYYWDERQRSDLLSSYRAAEELISRGGSYDPRYRLFRETFLSSLAALLTPNNLNEIASVIAGLDPDNSDSLTELAKEDFATGRQLLREYRQLRREMAAILKNRSIMLGRESAFPGLPSRQTGMIRVLQSNAGEPLGFLPGWIRAVAAGMLLVLIPALVAGRRRLLLALAPIVVFISMAASLLLARYAGLFFPIVSTSFVVLLFYTVLALGAGGDNTNSPENSSREENNPRL